MERISISINYHSAHKPRTTRRITIDKGKFDNILQRLGNLVEQEKLSQTVMNEIHTIIVR